MKIEHFAINVSNPIEMAQWYVNHLGLKIVLQKDTSPFMTFLADDSGRVMIEIYNNKDVEVPDYKNLNPLVIHLAFVTKNAEEDKNKLLKAGATLCSDNILEDGSHLVMLQDPWGLAIQLCKRATPLLLEKEIL
ncbi:VOC family protein [Wenyingzhuangia sp. IMCC45467]